MNYRRIAYLIRGCTIVIWECKFSNKLVRNLKVLSPCQIQYLQSYTILVMGEIDIPLYDLKTHSSMTLVKGSSCKADIL